jgi:hypothetical protein
MPIDLNKETFARPPDKILIAALNAETLRSVTPPTMQ